MTALPAQAPASVGVPVNVDSPGLTYVVAKNAFLSCQRRCTISRTPRNRGDQAFG